MTGDPGVKQPRTVTSDGRSTALVPEGVIFRDLATHADSRGSLLELFHPGWAWHPDPLVHAYMFTVRPGITKGWGRHERTIDRYANLFGEAMVILYDGRQGSPTEGMISEVPLVEHHRRLVAIPAGIWHAVACIGERDFVAVNFKTVPFDHADPDKFTLPLDTGEIPYDFDRLRRLRS